MGLAVRIPDPVKDEVYFTTVYMQAILKQRAAVIRLVIFDVDGVLTDGRLYFDDDGFANQAFNVKDGHGIRLLLHHGINVAVLSGRESAAASRRMADLGVECVYQGVRDKGSGFDSLIRDCAVAPENTAYMGDDLPDLAPMQRAGLACAVSDAHPEVIRCADWVTQSGGGCGAARELCEVLLEAQGIWKSVLEHCSA